MVSVSSRLYTLRPPQAVSSALSALRRLRRTRDRRAGGGAFEWVNEREGGTTRGIRGGRRGNLKGYLMGDLIGPGDLAAGLRESIGRRGDGAKFQKDANVGSQCSKVPEGRRSSAAEVGSNLSIPS